MDPVDAARRVAADLGLDASAAAALRDLRTTVVHLAPSPVVARVAPATEEDVVRRQVRVTAHAAQRGAPVAAPWSEPGPYIVEERVVTLWRYVEHDAEGPVDGFAAGRALREVHDALADLAPGDLPVFPRLEEVRAIVDRLGVEPEDDARLVEMVDRAATLTIDAPVQVVHADAWLGNVLSTPRGPLWSDFELTSVAPRELDLACNETASLDRGRRPEDDAFLAGYGDHDVALRRRLEVLELVPLTAWTFQLAGEKPEFLDAARARLTRALDGLRKPPPG